MAPLRSISGKIFLNAILPRTTGISSRLVSTVGKKEESAKDCNTEQTIFKKIPDFSKPLESKNWISFGFDEDRDKDLYGAHVVSFIFISFVFCGGFFLYYYFPDRNRNDWARREAFIRLHEREQLGLDPVDLNFIDPAKIVLPPDEELLEKDIVV